MTIASDDIQTEAGARASNQPLRPDLLRWRCDPGRFSFETTKEVKPVTGVIGQETAIDALRFGLESAAHGQNIYVKGLTGTGRMTLLRRLLTEIRPDCPLARDRCYAHNFDDPAQPKLITLPRGSARRLEEMINELADFISDDLGDALNSESIRNRRAVLQQMAQERIKKVAEPLEKEADAAGMALVTVTVGELTRPAIFPRVEGKPMPVEQFELLHGQGEISDEQYQAFHQRQDEFEGKLRSLDSRIREIVRGHIDAVRQLMQKETQALLAPYVNRIESAFPQPEVKELVQGSITDVIERRIENLEEQGDFTRRYRVNVILVHDETTGCPTIVENSPTHLNLIGSIDRAVVGDEIRPADHLSIRGGSLLEADGGFLVLDVRDVLSEPGAWKALVRTLRTGRLQIATLEESIFGRINIIKPEPIDITVKVILVGDAEMHYLLDEYDPDFSQLFKVLAEFDWVIANNAQSLAHYAEVIARIADEDDLLPFSREAIAALAEHGARIASSQKKLTTRFSRLADIAREAAYLAGKRSADRVDAEDVRETVRRTKRRADLVSRKFRELAAQGIIRVQTQGNTVGQINGMAVSHAGPLTYGFPARITATIGAGTSGVIHIERESKLSGAIHTKGFYILEGLLRFLLQTDHPLTFNASIAFEQSYGGIDGDSASGAEICCLISALAGAPVRQDLAMTGAIDQRGNILAVGGVNEKIEGFFDVCQDLGLTGTQGVLIPRSNADDLMLRHDVVQAAAEGRFHVFAVDTIHEALELMTGVSAGRRDRDGRYPPGTLLCRAMEQAKVYWKRTAVLPGRVVPLRDGTPEETAPDGGEAPEN